MLSLALSPLEQAVEQLDIGLQEARTLPANQLLRDGVIQRFEYSHELAIRFLQCVLETEFGDATDEMPYRTLLRTAGERGLIANVERWFAYREARNRTSHTYDAAVATQVYQEAQPFLGDARFLLDRLHALSNRPAA